MNQRDNSAQVVQRKLMGPQQGKLKDKVGGDAGV